MNLLTRKEAATRLRIGLRSLDRRLAEGKIECYRLGEGPRAPVRISEEQLAVYLDRDRTNSNDKMRQDARQILSR